MANAVIGAMNLTAMAGMASSPIMESVAALLAVTSQRAVNYYTAR